MYLRKNKKGDLLGNIFVVILSLIIFFALWPVVKIAINLGQSAAESSSESFLIGFTVWVILAGIIKWIFNTVSGGE